MTMTIRTRATGAGVGLAATTLLLAGCSVSTDPYSPVSARGTVTQGGAPAAARIRLTAGNFATARDYPDGSYSITLSGGGVPASNCGSVRIQAFLLGSDEEVIAEDEEFLGECGEHVVDFEFP